MGALIGKINKTIAALNERKEARNTMMAFKGKGGFMPTHSKDVKKLMKSQSKLKLGKSPSIVDLEGKSPYDNMRFNATMKFKTINLEDKERSSSIKKVVPKLNTSELPSIARNHASPILNLSKNTY